MTTQDQAHPEAVEAYRAPNLLASTLMVIPAWGLIIAAFFFPVLWLVLLVLVLGALAYLRWS